ncbi:hypothetical protein [Oceanirhabdus seepicola]|uniref:Uncharacterized protein n=1 Tax=Oceanirhabdus seepicola TaxID=2828781 RepID=A0A9J6PB45_9CLOT|nr:hypothetical protein [Oceanirhabdus seepicola]MCM1992493.1 hypothetical protein [Oceanirhabdus seepicola]
MISRLESINLFLKEKKLFFIINVLIICGLIFSLIYREGEGISLIKYLISQLFLIYGQGVVLTWVLSIKKDQVVTLVINYFLGISLVIFEYLISMSLFHQWRLLYIGYVIGTIGVIISFRNFKLKKLFSGLNNGLVTVFCIMWISTFFSLYIKNSMPDVIGRSGINQDLLWSIGNTEALMRSYPPIDSRMNGIPFTYHYFVNIYYAVISLTTGIDPTKLFFAYGYIVKMLFLVLCIFSFGKSYLKSNIGAGMLTFIYFFTNCFSLNRAYSNGYGVFMNSNLRQLTDGAFGFEMSIALLMVVFMFLFYALEEREWKKYILPSLMVFFALSGTKGPLALMVILILFTVLIIEFIIKKKINKKGLTLLVSFVLIFAILFAFILKSGSGDLNFELGYIAKDSLIGRKVIGLIGDGILTRIMIIPLHFYLYLPLASIPFVIWFWMRGGKINQCNTNELLIGGMAVLGIICAYMFSHYGHSEIYFIMTAIPFMEIAAVEFLMNNKLNKILKVIIMISFIVGVTTSYYSIKGRIDIGMKYNEIIKSKIEFTKGYHPNTITYKEYEGIKWIKDNTSEDSVILSDRYYISDNKVDKTARYFYYSTFSNRQFYLEGYFYFYAPEEYKAQVDKKKEIADKIYKYGDALLAKEQGINYIIISENLYDEEKELKNQNYIKVFDNEEMKIYKVNDGE